MRILSSRRFSEGRDDVEIGSAAAEITPHPLAYLSVAELDRLVGDVSGHGAWPSPLHLVEHRHCRADLPGGAVTALQRVSRHERLLHRMQITAGPEAFNGRNRFPGCGDRQDKTGI